MNPAERQLPRNGTRRFFWANSRSFSFASLGFRKEDRRLVELVYAFCRITDDIVDESGSATTEAIGRRLDEWLTKSRLAFDGGSSEIEWLDELMHESALRGVPFEVIRTLVDGVRKDAELTTIATLDELKSYCYGVASVVGVWLCYLFGVSDTKMLTRAEALGRAMQITNIIRDVGEDVRRGRLYLPTELLDRYGITQAELESSSHTGRIPERYDRLIDQLIDLADEDYRLAWEGIPRLPASFARASAVAAEVYRGINDQVVSNHYNNFTVRSRTGMITKIRLLGRALSRLYITRMRASRALDDTVAPSTGAILFLVVATVTMPSFAQADSDDMNRLRAYFTKSAQNEAYIDSAAAEIDVLRRKGVDERLLQGFEGALTMVRAKYAFWPPRKLELVLNGVGVLDSLVSTFPTEIEIRYLRLTSCYFLPGFLHRQSSVKEDFEALSRLLLEDTDQVPTEVFKRMTRFVLQNGDLDNKAYDPLYARLLEVQGEFLSETGM